MNNDPIDIARPIKERIHCFSHGENQPSHDLNNTRFWIGQQVKPFLEKQCVCLFGVFHLHRELFIHIGTSCSNVFVVCFFWSQTRILHSWERLVTVNVNLTTSLWSYQILNTNELIEFVLWNHTLNPHWNRYLNVNLTLLELIPLIIV